MLAGRSKRWIRKSGKRNFNIGIAREVAVLRLVKGALKVIDLGTDLNSPLKQVAIPFCLERGEFRKCRKREINFCDCSRGPVVLDFLNEVRREVRRIDQAHERTFGIGVRNNGSRSNLLTGGEHHSSGA